MSSNLLFRLSPTRTEGAGDIDEPLFILPDLKGILMFVGVYFGPLPKSRDPQEPPYRYQLVSGQLEPVREPSIAEETLNGAATKDKVLLVSWDAESIAGFCLTLLLPEGSRFFDPTSPKRILVFFDVEILQPIDFDFNLRSHFPGFEYTGTWSLSTSERQLIPILLDPMSFGSPRQIDLEFFLKSVNRPVEMYFYGAYVFWVE